MRPRVPESISWALSGEELKSGLMLFEALDADSDGFVTKDDFLKHLPETAPPAIARRLVSMQGGAPTYEEDSPLFRVADIDKDGKLNDLELLVLFRSALFIGTDDSKLAPIPSSATDVSALRGAIDKVNMKDAVDAAGNTPMHLAASKSGAVPKLNLFLEVGYNPNVRNLKGERPLHLAALEGQLPAVEALLANGADAKSKDLSGRSPLDCALMAGKSRKIEAVLRAAGSSSSWWEAERVRRTLAAVAEAERVTREAKEAQIRAAVEELRVDPVVAVRKRLAELPAERRATNKFLLSLRFPAFFMYDACMASCSCLDRFRYRDGGGCCEVPILIIFVIIFSVLYLALLLWLDVLVMAAVLLPCGIIVLLWRVCERDPASVLSAADRERMEKGDAAPV